MTSQMLVMCDVTNPESGLNNADAWQAELRRRRATQKRLEQAVSYRRGADRPPYNPGDDDYYVALAEMEEQSIAATAFELGWV